jgi:beta-glucosidase
VRRLLVARFRLGTIGEDAGPYARISPAALDSSEHRDLAKRAALESIVLLRNRRGILPLDPSRVKRLAVFGALARDRDALIGDYAGEPSTLLTIEQALNVRARLSGVQVRYYAPDRGAYSPAAAEQIAKRNDAVVAVLGLSSAQEGEEGNGGDRETIELPKDQARLLAALSRSGRPVIVVLTGGSAFALKSDAAGADAILDAWYAGEEGGPALAAVLFGDANPAGRLPLTFYAQSSDLPPFKDYAMSGRTYRYFRGEPAFRFGDGLSYTRFAYRDAAVQIDPDLGPVASVTVENLGPRDGDEVVQVYVNPPAEQSARIENRQLAAFARLSMPPGAARRVTIPLGWWAVSTVDAAGKRAVRAGTFHFSIGGGQPGPGASTTEVTLDLPAPYDGLELSDADYALGQATVAEP